ncbi:O-antigen ligase family protein [Brevundimonas sp. DWR2-3-1b1]|uniref:O-antigen ligase family protein n=1 Tax=unclassified Brevundimonas TaxID=2622653 RepID=UPI003CEC0D00
MGAAYRQAVLVLLGLGVTLPIFLAPGHVSGPRLGDLALAVALPLAVMEWRRMTPALKTAGPVAAAFLTVTLLLQASQVGERLNAGDGAFWFRWIVAALVAPAAASLIVRDERRRRLFFASILIGAACHLATYGLALLVGLERLQDVGLASPRALLTTTAAQIRLTTLAEHPNAAMAMIGLAVPAGVILAGRRWGGRPTTLAGGGLAILGFLSTLSRGGMLAAVTACLVRVVVGWRWRERARPLGVVLAVCVLGGGVLAMQAGIDDARFAGRFDRAALEENLAGRVATWGRTVGLVFQRPMGAGWSSADEMGAFRALSVSHNGYLFMARTVGVIAALVMLGLHLWSAARLDALTPLSVYLLMTLFSEDLTQGAGFVFLSCLVAALAWRRPVAP